MEKKLLVQLDEQSKTVVAKVSIEYIGTVEEVPKQGEVVEELRSLFNEVHKEAQLRTMRK